MAELISLREYARRRGCTLYAVQKAIAAGRIKTFPDAANRPRIDPELADQEWQENTSEAMQRLPEPEKRASQSGGDGGGNGGGDDDDDESEIDPETGEKIPNYFTSRAKREAYSARLTQLEYEELIGKLVDAELVKRQAFETARMVRDAILNIPNRIAPELASETDPVKVRNILTLELNKALAELTDVQKRRE